ncbi:MAG: hypothetical protein ACJ75F_10530 [Flavisolibacter sp.]
MNAKTTQQEILLLTGTRFSSNMYCAKDESQEHLSESEKLQEACWNGMVQELLPELREEVNNKKLFLWNIVQGDAFLELKFSDRPSAEEDMRFSIDPYTFLSYRIFS